MRKINGKEISEALKLLTEDFPKEQMKFFNGQKDQPYFGIEVYQKRLNQVIGVLNYSFVTHDIQVCQNGPQQNIIVNAELTIYDDEGKVVASRGCGGAYSIKYATPKKDDVTGEIKEPKPVKVANDVENACYDAFKKCCKLFGISTKQLREIKSLAPSSRNSNSNNWDEKEIVAKVVSSVSSIGQTGGYGVTIEIGGEKIPLKIWKEGIAKLKENPNFQLDSFVKMKPGTELSFIGKEGFYSGKKQIVFVSPISKK